MKERNKNKEILGKKFCNKKCYNEFRNNKKPNVKCNYCGKIFKKRPRDIKKKNFCCRKCFYKWERGINNPSWKGGETFWKKKVYVKKNNLKKFYGLCAICSKRLKKDQKDCCSYKCSTIYSQKNTHNRMEKECKFCKSIFIALSVKQEFCSKNCKDKFHSIIMRNKGNPNFKDKDSRVYPYSWNKRFKTEFKQKYNYTCQNCGVINKSIHIHHVDNNKLNQNEENLICLCNSCHMKIHRGSLKL